MGPGGFFLLLIQTLPTFWATRFLISRISICLLVHAFQWSGTQRMGRRIQWMVKDSMDGEGINGWKGRRIQWMVQDSISFISS
jgi:hypothetical protein